MSRFARTAPAGTRCVSEMRPLRPGQDASAAGGRATAAEAEIAATTAGAKSFMTHAPLFTAVGGRGQDALDATWRPDAAHRAFARYSRRGPPDASKWSRWSFSHQLGSSRRLGRQILSQATDPVRTRNRNARERSTGVRGVESGGRI